MLQKQELPYLFVLNSVRNWKPMKNGQHKMSKTLSSNLGWASGYSRYFRRQHIWKSRRNWSQRQLLSWYKLRRFSVLYYLCIRSGREKLWIEWSAHTWKWMFKGTIVSSRQASMLIRNINKKQNANGLQRLNDDRGNSAKVERITPRLQHGNHVARQC